MGLRYKKRGRMVSLGAVDDALLASIGATNFEYEKFDEQLIFDKINRQLDRQQEKIDNRGC